MKKISIYISIILYLFTIGNIQAYAEKIGNPQSTYSHQTTITIGTAFSEILKLKAEKVPESYKYIRLNITGVVPGSNFYKSLQKLVYLNMIPNKKVDISETRKMSAKAFYILSIKVLGFNKNNIGRIKGRKANIGDIMKIKKFAELQANIKKRSQSTWEIKKEKVIELNHTNRNITPSDIETNQEINKKYKIFTDVYNTIRKSHYNKDKITGEQLIEGATKGLAKSSGDKFTSYFPPAENKNFIQSLDGEFEGIGSYVEMIKPGVLSIISPISGSPSEKAGLKGGDIITHVNEKKVEINNSLGEVVSWIKGPKGSTVTLTVLRGETELTIKVVRGVIIIKTVEHKKIDASTYYLKLLTFGDDIGEEFTEALQALRKENDIKKIILDLRNNPGGYLGEVDKILGYFVPKGKRTILVKYLNGEKAYRSSGKRIVNFSKYRIIILQNEGSASASEIMVGTIKDYYPNTTIVGMKSYGKGSVQTIKQYKDNSSLKYTIAKWFTGKTSTGIDGIGIPVDVKIEFDFEKFKETQVDNQLEYAKKIK